MFDICVIGSGPAGLACGLSAQQKGLTCVILEKGVVADAIRRFPLNMKFFSSSDMLEIGGTPFISGDLRPSRQETVRYYHAVAESAALDIRTHVEVMSIDRAEGYFIVRDRYGKSVKARNVVVATGYFDSPHVYDIPGSELPKVHRYYDEAYGYVGRKVALVGGRNSVVDTALEMCRAGVDVTIIHRGPSLSKGVKYWLLPDIENRIREGRIKGLFNTTIRDIREKSLVLKGEHAGEIENDVLFVFIGYTIDPTLLRSAGVSIHTETMIPVHNPTTFETDVSGLYVAGSIAAGIMNNKIFIENGRLHGDAITESVLKRKNQLEKR